MRLIQYFTKCAIHNYASEGNLLHEDFILAANCLGKDRDRQLEDKKIWETTVNVLMDYIKLTDAETQGSKKPPNPSLAALCLKLISKNYQNGMSEKQCEEFFAFIKKENEKLNHFDRPSLLKSMSDI
jgi:ATP-dependent exoDNAse (exonuclease V) alpha subunit